MRPSHCVLPKAFAFAVLAGLLAAGLAFAQSYDPALRSLDLGSDVPRSPRLLGMGSLSISVPDRHQSFSLWDFAGSPVGVYGEDSSSTVELRPGSGSASGAHNGASGLEREDLAGRASRMGFELFHRDAEGSAWGATGQVRSLRADQLYDMDTEMRRTISEPEIDPIITGPFPYWHKDKLRYAVRLQLAHEHLLDDHLGNVSNAAGEFISLDGPMLRAPELFEPTESTVRRTSLGAALSYPAGDHATLALGYDAVGDRIAGRNDGIKSLSQVNESRPIGIAQATLVGKLGKSFEYGLDEKHWNSSSHQKWYFSISGGVGAIPLIGQGELLERAETGNAFNGSFRWTTGNLRLAGQYWTLMSRAVYTPQSAVDRSSFNVFLSNIYYRVGADTLALPDSVIANQSQSNAFGYVGGVSWKLERGTVGLEYHWGRETQTETITGVGPKAIAYDVRAGLEHQFSAIVAGRVGGGMLWRDQDQLTRNNNWRGESSSLGLGLTPPVATWGLDIGWTMTWLQTDYQDPLVHRSSHQQLQALLHWTY